MIILYLLLPNIALYIIYSLIIKESIFLSIKYSEYSNFIINLDKYNCRIYDYLKSEASEYLTKNKDTITRKIKNIFYEKFMYIFLIITNIYTLIYSICRLCNYLPDYYCCIIIILNNIIFFTVSILIYIKILYLLSREFLKVSIRSKLL